MTSRPQTEFGQNAKRSRRARVVAAVAAVAAGGDEAFFDRAITAVGVAQGTRPDVGSNALFVVLVFGQGR